jgi:hypothetical protein
MHYFEAQHTFVPKKNVGFGLGWVTQIPRNPNPNETPTQKKLPHPILRFLTKFGAKSGPNNLLQIFYTAVAKFGAVTLYNVM